ncbi:DNA-binding transcriptional regulator, AcrR family [Terribacillus halophilus]|uniref:DNA-binding transcriptional regulator, AcrR family n=1 Tax=Terribacillus halophilus TaxID=361279 RepID=A0A1G6UDL1_9BACI|nr:forespore capture DNA-binding protein RefZ [Terribacillus halophilus]SDD38655.1 DNA-binding transcriptional regulator, AcrR family [Terribacillus halophilus]
MKKNDTKQKVMDAACQLFYTKGYHGTSVRDIAGKASVNVSLINYYYKSKQGLLEASVVLYYEEYLAVLEKTAQNRGQESSGIYLKQLIEAIIHYKLSQNQFTAFIQRELMLDSVFVREMAVTYLAKESHTLKQAFRDYLDTIGIREREGVYLYMQLSGMLSAPFTMSKEMKGMLLTEESRHYFCSMYTSSIHHWIDTLATVSPAALRAVSAN